MDKLSRVILSVNPRIHFGLGELFQYLSGRDEFNVVYLSDSAVFSSAEIYFSPTPKDDEKDTYNSPESSYEEEDEDEYEEEIETDEWEHKEFDTEEIEFKFYYQNFLMSGSEVMSSGLFYGNLFVRLPEVIELSKKWESLGLAYSEGVSKTRKVLEQMSDKGIKWLAFFNIENTAKSEKKHRDRITLWWEDLQRSYLGDAIKRGLDQVEEERVREELKKSVKSGSFVLDLEIKDIVLGERGSGSSYGVLRDFGEVSDFEYEGKFPSISREGFKEVLGFNERLKAEVGSVSKALAFFEFRKELVREVKEDQEREKRRKRYHYWGTYKYIESPKGVLWDWEKVSYEKLGIKHFHPEAPYIFLPGECSSTISLGLKRVVRGRGEGLSAEVGLVFVGILDYNYYELMDEYKKRGSAEFKVALVPYIATRQKLALSATPVESLSSYYFKSSVQEETSSYFIAKTSNEPCGVSVHLFEKVEKDQEKDKPKPDFQAIIFTRGELVERKFSREPFLGSSSSSSPSPVLEVIVPDKDGLYFSRAQYLDLEDLARMYYFPNINNWAVKRDIKDIVKKSYPEAIEKINFFLNNSRWSAENLVHKRILKILETFKRRILNDIDKMVENPDYPPHEKRGAVDWSSSKNPCFRTNDGSQNLEIDLGEVSQYERSMNPFSLLLSKIFYHQGIINSYSDEIEVRPADVLVDIANLGFDGKAEEVLGKVYDIIRALGGNREEREEDDEDYPKLLYERTEALRKALSGIKGRDKKSQAKCTMVMEYQPTLFSNAPINMNPVKPPKGSSADHGEALVLLMTSLYLALDLEEEGLGIVVGLV